MHEDIVAKSATECNYDVVAIHNLHELYEHLRDYQRNTILVVTENSEASLAIAARAGMADDLITESCGNKIASRCIPALADAPELAISIQDAIGIDDAFFTVLDAPIIQPDKDRPAWHTTYGPRQHHRRTRQ